MINQLLDRRYQITRVLGAGGFGQTYIAQDTRIPGNPLCVVKHLKPASSDPNYLQTARRLFNSEAETLAKLGNHDQIPRLLAYFEEHQEFYLVQEFIAGHILSTELASGQPWTESQVIELLQDVLNILVFVHSHGVIHRDIKPDNLIRRTSDNKFVLIDFGAIKQVQTQMLTVQGQGSVTVAVGTPGYMPIEQGQGKPRPNSDIYALGMIGLQALTGLYPSQLQRDINTGEITWQHLVSASQGLVAVLTRMTHYHFKYRYQSAIEALQALQQLTNPAYTPTPTATTAASPLVYELILEWVEAGQVKTQVIYDQQPSQYPATVRIGRDPQQCDLVLSELTVSGLHAEIFFNQQEQRFKVRSLRQTNPPVVDGQPLLAGEASLSQGSSLRLGQVELRVKAIAHKPLPATPRYTPTSYPTQPLSPPPQPVAPTLQPPQPINSEQNPTLAAHVNPSVPTPVPTPAPGSPNKLPWLVGISVAAVTVVIGGLAFVQGQNSSNRVSDANPTTASPSGVTPSPASCSVIVDGNIRSEPASFRNNVIKYASGEQLLVTGKQTPGGWIQVKLRDGALAWAFKDRITNYTELDSCLQRNKISVETIADIPRPAPPPQPENLAKPTEQPSSPSPTPTESQTPTPPTPTELQTPTLPQPQTPTEQQTPAKPLTSTQQQPATKSPMPKQQSTPTGQPSHS